MKYTIKAITQIKRILVQTISHNRKLRMKKLSIKNEQTDFLLYTAPEGKVKVEVFLNEETVWLTQKAVAQLFGVQVPNV